MKKDKADEIYRQIMQGSLKQGIAVLEGGPLVPFLKEEFYTKFIYIGLCMSGHMKGSYDYGDFYFKAGDICWLLPSHVMRVGELSSDYSVLSVFVDVDFFQKMDRMGNLPRYCYPFFVTTLSLPPQHFELMLSGFRMIGLLVDSSIAHRDELICKLVDLLAVMGDECIVEQCPDLLKKQKMHVLLFENFYNAILQHYRQSREVAYYARLQSLTPKYFAKVIKEVTGRSASDWINGYVMVQARWLLQHDHKKTIKQIAYQLGFSEQASFTRFFKENTGLSPSEYRAQN